MKRIIMFVLLFAALKVAGQTTGYLRFDTVKIMKQNGTCELYIINKTKDSLGLLTNVGGGLTRFIKPKVLNDSAMVIGLDTLVIRGAGGSGSATLSNVGSGYRLVKTADGQVKTIFVGYGLNADSTTNTNALTFSADTSSTNHLVTQSDLNDAVAGGGGSQTWPQTLSTGRTFAANDSAIITNLAFKFKGGTVQTDTLDVLKTVRIGTSQSVDDRLKMIVKDASVDTTSFAAIELKTTNDDQDLNVDGATIVKHDSAYKLTPGYGNTLQVYTLAGSAGTIIGNNNFVGVTTPYVPGENEVSNGFIRFELGPIWPKSEKMRLNNRGEIIFGWTKVRSHLASQTGTTVNDPVNTFLSTDVGKFFCWGDRELGGSQAFADRITGYIDANNITVETNRTISAQGGRVCYPNAIVDTLGNALYRFVSLDSIKFATGDETAFFKLKTVVDTIRLVRDGAATDAAFDATNGITVARLPRDTYLKGTTYSKLHFMDATHTLSDITANSTATTITTLDNLPINFNPNNATAATITSTKVQNFKPTIISAIADAPIAKLDVRNPDANISMYIENSRASGTNFGAIIDVTAASSENRAMYATANSGTVNKAIMVPGSSASGANDFGLSIETTAKNYFAGKVGVLASTPDSTLHVAGSLHTTAGVRMENLPAAVGTKAVRYDPTTGNLSYADTTTGSADGNGIYGGNGSLSGSTTVTGGANGLTFTSTRTTVDATVNINNTSTGGGLIVSASGAGTGIDASSSTGYGGNIFSTSGPGLQVGSSSNTGLLVSSTTGLPISLQTDPASTNTDIPLISVYRKTSGTAGANIAGHFAMYNENGSGSDVLSTKLTSKLTTVTAGAEVSQFEILGINSGASARKAALAGNGLWTWDGYGAGTHTVTPATTPVMSSSGVIGERVAPKIYTALLTATAGNNPTATVLGTNEIGSIAWTRNSAGNYTGTLTGAFTSNKTWAIVQAGDMAGNFVNGFISSTSANTVTLVVLDNVNMAADDFGNMSIEIRVYP